MSFDDNTSKIIISIIAAGGAIGGALIGSYFTYFRAKQIEEERQKREEQNERKFNDSIRKIIYYELLEYEHILQFQILQKSESLTSDKVRSWQPRGHKHRSLPTITPETMYLTSDGVITLDGRLKHLPRQFYDLTLDRKAKVFEGDVLIFVENAYSLFKEFTETSFYDIDSAHRIFVFSRSNAKFVLTSIESAYKSIDKNIK